MAWVDNIPRTDQTFGEATDDIRNNLALLEDSYEFELMEEE